MSSQRPFTYMQLAQVEMLEKLHAQFLQDPLSVEPSWRYFFEGVAFGESPKASKAEKSEDERIYHLIDAYRKLGHLQAHINPIATDPITPILTLSSLNFKEAELEKLFPTCGLFPETHAALSKIIEMLEETYCGSKGVEYMGLHSLELEEWLQNHIEPSHFQPNFSIEQKKWILEQLNNAEAFETFLHTKYVGQKRFSLEGGETLIPIFGTLIEKGAELGVNECVIGMSHRGRLNVLANILNKSFGSIFGEFEDFLDPELNEGVGDVKYHNGFSSNITTSQGHSVHISLTANPSHLESVNPL